MNQYDENMIKEILYLLNEYHSGDYTRSEFEEKVSDLVIEGKISQEASKKVVEIIFNFEHNPNFGMVWQGGGCGGSYVKRPHWKPGFGQQNNSNNRGSYGSYSSQSSGSC